MQTFILTSELRKRKSVVDLHSRQGWEVEDYVGGCLVLLRKMYQSLTPGQR